MKLLSISGGSTKIAGLFGVAKAINEKNYNPDIYVGISAGSVLALPIMLGKWKETEKMILNLSLDDFFINKPVNEKGKLTLNAIGRVITGKISLGTQDVGKAIRKIVSEKEFESLKKTDKKIFVGTVNFHTGKREYFNVLEYNFVEALALINASASIPLFVEPVKFKGQLYFDGGVRDHSGANIILNQFSELKEVVSIYSRSSIAGLKEWSPSDLFSVLERTVDIMSNEISQNDEQLERVYCENNNIKLSTYYLPIMLKTLYDVNKERLNELLLTGYNEGKNYKNG